ncbi:hypothetical protein [Thalassotalea sp. PS06]|uniref:hypothetical protein n=1 Tax=Thalassotalea sp. PS06 TaxID=2594005 RepID=UPI001C8F37EA|nr:hypothetical protein [Thalassotalea sp. PS06]
MKKILLLVLMSTFLAPSFANTQSDQLASCMVDSLNGKERKKLAQWIFFAMSAHPEIEVYSRVTQENRDETDQYIGNLLTRLLTKDCPEQASAVLKSSNSTGMGNAFRLVGQVAMRELMTNSNVSNAIANFEQHMDSAKISQLSQ